jgi:hypothetical protein
MHHTMTMAASARTVTSRQPAVAVKSDFRTGHDIAYVTRGHASGCPGTMAYYTRSGDPPGTWEGRARKAGDHTTAAALDGEAQAIAEGLVATSWLHTISRDGDPQLHVHLAVLNAVRRADGADDQWRAAGGQHFYQLRHLYGVTVDRAFEQNLLDMGYAMAERADGNGAEVGGVSPQVMDRFSSRAKPINGRLRGWVDQYTARHGTPPSWRTIYLMGQQIAKDTRRPKAEARQVAGGQVTGHLVSDQERLTAWEEQTTSHELQVLSAVHAEAKAYAARSARRPRLSEADKARPRGSPWQRRSDSEACGGFRTCALKSTGP